MFSVYIICRLLEDWAWEHSMGQQRELSGPAPRAYTLEPTLSVSICMMKKGNKWVIMRIMIM